MTATDLGPAPVVIQVRINEGRRRTGRERIPYGVDEIVECALEVAEAGASILHWHARSDDGASVDEVEPYLGVIKQVSERTALLLNPKLLPGDSVEANLEHVRAAREDGMRVELVSVEPNPVDASKWDGPSRTFRPAPTAWRGREQLEAFLQHLKAFGVCAMPFCWSPGDVRTAACYVAADAIPGSTFWELVFPGDELPYGAHPSVAALNALLEELPADAQWSVLCPGGDALEYAPTVLRLGGHIAVGLGDYDYTDRGVFDNAELVRRVGHVAREVGRPVATPADVRAMLGLAVVSA